MKGHEQGHRFFAEMEPLFPCLVSHAGDRTEAERNGHDDSKNSVGFSNLRFPGLTGKPEVEAGYREKEQQAANQNQVEHRSTLSQPLSGMDMKDLVAGLFCHAEPRSSDAVNQSGHRQQEQGGNKPRRDGPVKFSNYDFC